MENSKIEAASYKKRPLWQWIAIYLVIGVVIYAGIYFLFLSKRGGSPAYSYPTSTSNNGNQTSSDQTGQQTATSTTNPSAQEVSVTLTQGGFSPNTVTIKAGTKVVWTNQSGSSATVNSNPHPVHTDYPPLNLGSFANGASLSLVFPTPGTYGYHNHLNPSQSGTIIVD